MTVQFFNLYVLFLGSDDLIMAWGENMVTLWNVEYGYIIATVQIIETMPLSSPLHVKCDRVILLLLLNNFSLIWNVQRFLLMVEADFIEHVHLLFGLPDFKN